MSFKSNNVLSEDSEISQQPPSLTPQTWNHINGPCYCFNCLSEALPFYSETDSDTLILNPTQNISLNALHLNSCTPNFNFLTDESEHHPLLNCLDIDPDNNYFNNISYMSSYSSPYSLSSKFIPSSPKFSIMHINCRSILSKMNEIKELLSYWPVTILSLTETWLEENENDLVVVPGYQFLSKPRNHNKGGGGTGFLIKQEISFDVLDDFTSFISFEGLFIRINHKLGSSIVGVIYRPPGSKLNEFTIEIDSVLSKIRKKSKEHFLVGDFNADLLKINNHKHTEDFFNCLLSHHLLPTITKPTRITSDTSTLIDNIFTNTWNKLEESTILVSDISDHLPIIALFSQDLFPPSKPSSRFIRKITPESNSKFIDSLSKINWTPVYEACEKLDANGAYDIFFKEYKRKYDESFPISEIKFNKRSSPKHPWMTQGLLKSCKTKAKLYLKFIKHPSEQNKNKFVSYRNKFKSIRIQAEKSFYAAEFCKQSNNLRQTWKIIKNLIGNANNDDNDIKSIKSNGNSISDPTIIATKFNDFFTGIADSLASNIPNTTLSIEHYMSQSQKDSFGLIEISKDELIHLCNNIHPSHAKGIDDIDPTIVLPSIASIASPLVEIINCSFTTGVFPHALKIAKVVPIFKKGSRDNVSNYRPISILPIFSKLFEKAMLIRLNDYVTKSKILFPSQHGFQSGHSTYMPLLSMQDMISAAIDNGQYSIGIFLDLAKAFDTIDHNILLKKLHIYGIRNTQLNWFKNYLENRMQLVSCNGTYSPLKLIKYGVPQGSILGPLLFILYINDLPNVSTKLFFILFADDTNVFNSHSCIETLIEQTNIELEKISEWFRANKLTLNLDKTNYILFRSYKKPPPITQSVLSIMGAPIAQVQSCKFLGVFVDQHLSWREHIYHISSKIAKNVGILSRIAKVIPLRIRSTLYFTLIYPYLSYCNIVWACAYKSHLDKLYTLQKRAVRFVANIPYRSHTKSSFFLHKLFNIGQIRELQIGIFIFRYFHNLLPSIFHGFFHLNTNIHYHSSRNVGSLYIPFARTNTRLSSIKFSGPRCWNYIPLEIRTIPYLIGFKRELSIYILRKSDSS